MSRRHLLAALAEHGVTEADYRKVQKARRLVDEVNAALASRGSGLMYAVMACAVSPVRDPAPPAVPAADGAATGGE